ncbi:hypothetical protein L202_07148 [Cryptococcus amylolentus CBS 6039]|uniref:Major facilitator superfamily (MFS) profile domain-containing protein n=2 Tax=Cryptococcus amylolentus TaxID=104669 RepID=A0A1E3HES8_9TREE|nr:hypothetical protein L202_07148 [Cryptococcus amylolentus CBS 6039]ODN74842.1 hypothetical protein L202_07148 [Cryptococcus amylolentus CBS 6039]ODO01742.1 hypothetical protein I350_06570 [Cryptococcus amylolentus CBS 6273]
MAIPQNQLHVSEEAIELSDLPKSSSAVPLVPIVSYHSTNDHEDIEPIAQYALPPVDGGKQAWIFLAAATMIEILVWGIPFAIGVLLAFWTSTLFPDQSSSTLTLAATLQTGLLYMNSAVIGPLLTAVPRWQKTFQVIGILAASVALIASAFASKPWHILVTIGLLYPLAGAAYFPCGTLLFEWFHARRGLASGVMYAGDSQKLTCLPGGFIFPFIMSGLLQHLGYKKAMIITGSVFGVVGTICLCFIRRRVPIASRYQPDSERRRENTPDWSFLKSFLLIISLATILLTSLGNFIPSLWIPTYANDLHLSHPNGANLLSILNAASVPGNALMGLLSDRLPMRIVILISCLFSGLSVAFLWGFGTSKGMLVAFCVVFGMFGPSFCAVWSKMNAAIAKDNTFQFGMIFSFFMFTRGVGNFSSGPISEALLKYDALHGTIGGYGFNNYGVLLLFSSLMILSGTVTGALFVEKR